MYCSLNNKQYNYFFTYGDQILEFLENHSTCILAEIKELLSSMEINCSLKTITRFLHGQLITIKKARGCVQERNSERIKDSRYNYAYRYGTEGWKMRQCIYIDEMGFNLWTRRPYGRSKIGCPVNVIVPTNRGGNISLIMAISRSGPVHTKVCQGSVNHGTYQEFIEELSAKLPVDNCILIHDNASIHRESISIHRICNLPPYSPFLNPIETVFSKLKREVGSQLSNTPLLDMTTAQRTSTLKAIIESSTAKEDYRDLTNYYRHCKRYLVRCVAKEDIFGG